MTNPLNTSLLMGGMPVQSDVFCSIDRILLLMKGLWLFREALRAQLCAWVKPVSICHCNTGKLIISNW